MRTGPAIKAVTFDAGGTLLEPWPSVGHIYAEVAARFGVAGADPARLNQQFVAAWRVKRGFDYSRTAWLDLVERSFVGIAEPLPDGFFPAVYERFTEPDAWHVFDDVRPTLDALARHGTRLAVVSNWDDRLEPLLQRLGLRDRFEVVVVSCHAGFTKPAPGIFAAALAQLGLPPEATLHVGDSVNEDVTGARAASLHARLIRRHAQPVPGEQVRSLVELLELVRQTEV